MVEESAWAFAALSGTLPHVLCRTELLDRVHPSGMYHPSMGLQRLCTIHNGVCYVHSERGRHSEENGDEKEDGKKEHKGREEGARNGGRKMTLASDDKGENVITIPSSIRTLPSTHCLQPVITHTIIALLRYHALPCLNLRTLSKHETSTVGIGSGADPGCEYGSGGTTCMIRREQDDKEDQDKRGRVLESRQWLADASMRDRPGGNQLGINNSDNDKAYVSLQCTLQWVLFITSPYFLMDATFATAHYFYAWIDVQGLPFHISLIQPRWYQDPAFATELIPAACRTHEVKPQEFKFKTSTIRPYPLGQCFTMFKPQFILFWHVQTSEQSSGSPPAKHRGKLLRADSDPPVISYKGLPRTAQLMNAREERSQGGGGTAGINTRRREVINSLADSRVNEDNLDSGPNPKKSRSGRTYKCALCRKEGHNHSHCPNIE
ncbi:hypothetical protein DFH09DRAFT_1077376 [Mycena vulgaris]|nr:hypothetical protein DFH09DRAFT_1077376 [Mycena vulgaris]